MWSVSESESGPGRNTSHKQTAISYPPTSSFASIISVLGRSSTSLGTILVYNLHLSSFYMELRAQFVVVAVVLCFSVLKFKTSGQMHFVFV